jgi:antitoxin CptB
MRKPPLAQGLGALYIPGHMTIDHDSRLRRLKFRAWHRGFREADLILGPFADTHGPNLTPEQLDTFETLMEESDREIYAWIVGQEPTPAKFDTDVLTLIKTFRYEAHAVRPVGDGA